MSKHQVITTEHLQSLIKETHYHHFDGTTLTVCVLVLHSGFAVTGESACISSDFFNAEKGCEIAYNNAFQKLWQLEAYRLKAQ